MRRLVALSFVFSAVATAAWADPTLAQFRTWNEDGQTIYLRGLHDGFLWANADLGHGGSVPLFCVPGRLALTTDQVASIVERYADENADIVSASDEYGLVALEALQDVFPCPGQDSRGAAIDAAVEAAAAAAEAADAAASRPPR